jgi:acyl carrier protein
VCQEYHALKIFGYRHAPGPIACSDAEAVRNVGDWIMSISSSIEHATAMNEGVAINVRKLIAEHLRVKTQRVSDQAHFFNDLGADWLARLELIIAIEDHFGIELADDVVEKIVVVGDLIRFIEAHRPH